MTSLRSEIESTPHSVSDRRTVQLTGVTEGTEDAGRPPVRPTPRPVSRRARLLTTKDGWLRLAELVIGDWASTLRGGFLLLVLLAALLVVIGVVFGVLVGLIGTAAVLVVYLIGRRRGALER